MKKINILIVDDCKTITLLEKNVLEKVEKFNIVGIALNSKQEIEMIEKYLPDIVISDILRKKEDTSGLDIAIKYEKERMNVKFIFITACDKNEILYKCNHKLPNNIIGYIRKPINWKTIAEEIGKMYIRSLGNNKN